MGYNATVVVLLDRLSEIERDPEFGKKLADAIRHKVSFGHSRNDRAPYVTGQTQVISVDHADAMQIVAVGGNTGRMLGYGWCGQTDKQIIDGLRKDYLRTTKDAGQTAKRIAEEYGIVVPYDFEQAVALVSKHMKNENKEVHECVANALVTYTRLHYGQKT